MRGRKAEIVPLCEDTPDDVPQPPEDLSADALAEWNRTLPILLTERRTLSVADLSIFAAYCTAVGMMAGARRTINTEGMTYMGASGPKRHPACSILSDAMTQARQLAAELGMTPASRSRPAIREGAELRSGPGNDIYGDLFGTPLNR